MLYIVVLTALFCTRFPSDFLSVGIDKSRQQQQKEILLCLSCDAVAHVVCTLVYDFEASRFRELCRAKRPRAGWLCLFRTRLLDELTWPSIPKVDPRPDSFLTTKHPSAASLLLTNPILNQKPFFRPTKIIIPHPNHYRHHIWMSRHIIPRLPLNCSLLLSNLSSIPTNTIYQIKTHSFTPTASPFLSG